MPLRSPVSGALPVAGLGLWHGGSDRSRHWGGGGNRVGHCGWVRLLSCLLWTVVVLGLVACGIIQLWVVYWGFVSGAAVVFAGCQGRSACRRILWNTARSRSKLATLSLVVVWDWEGGVAPAG